MPDDGSPTRSAMKPDDEYAELVHAMIQMADVLHIALTGAEGLLEDQAIGRQRRPFEIDLTRKSLALCREELRQKNELLARVLRARPLRLRNPWSDVDQ